MYKVERLGSVEYFNNKKEIEIYFGKEYDPKEADQGDIVITNYENGETIVIDSKEDYEDFVLNAGFDKVYEELLKDDKYLEFTEFAYDSGEIPSSKQDADNILEWEGDLCLIDEYNRIFSTTGVYLAEIIKLEKV